MITEENDVIFETLHNAGIITLNRPRVLNCINVSMVKKIMTKLREWENTRSLVIIKGTGEKAFCAGGDVKLATHKIEGPRYFRTEFILVNYINNYKIPYVALIDGIVMGGGLGLAVHGKYRVATEKTLAAMPENKIGFFPDVGGTYFLPRLRDNIGLLLGLTGDSLKGHDVMKAGIATHLVSSKRMYELQTLLSRCSSEPEVSALLNKFNEVNEEEFSLAPHMKHIKYCFAAGSIEEIVERLEQVQTPWATRTLETLRAVCPGSLKITLRAMQRGAQLDLGQCLRMEFRLAIRCINSHDFSEGVRALLIDKDHKPQWNPGSLEDVTDDYVDSFFKKLPANEELELIVM